MPEQEREPTEEEKKGKLREEALTVLKSEGVKNIYSAAWGNDIIYAGQIGKSATMGSYLRGLASGDPAVGHLASDTFSKSALEQIQLGRDPRDYGAITPQDLLETAKGFYSSSIDNVKVGDMLDLMEIKSVHEKNIPIADRSKYMKDFKERNKKMYDTLFETYLSGVRYEGIGGAMIESAKTQRKSLEQRLQEDPDAKRNSQRVGFEREAEEE